jgi:hypothetical protein
MAEGRAIIMKTTEQTNPRNENTGFGDKQKED